jgi:amino acid adenylation domain-containing protein
MSYSELNGRAEQLAGHLQSLGVQPEVPVGLCVERSFDYVVAALAIWKAGGAYVPLDPAWPAEHREFILADAQAPVLITRSGMACKARYIVNLDHDAEAIARSSAPSNPGTTRDHLAYIIYTSGTSGKPKGVEITHGNLLNLVFWHRRAFGVTGTDRASHVSGLAFDAAVWELWPYLSAGSTIVLADERIRTSAELMREWLAAQSVTIAFVPTALAEPMLTADWPAQTALRFLLTGADTLHRYPAADIPFRVVNNYGPTECTVVATSGAVPVECGCPEALPAIGAPIANTQVYLLDNEGQPVPAGSTGEIYIGGTSVGRGYRNRPELTAERFLENPYSSSPGARMYRTGDLGTLREDGKISFRGRIDNQEKIRGHRIEPDEIVSVLDQHPGVTSSAVLARADATGERRLVAYIGPGPDAPPSSAELREFVARRLPEYMVPSVFVRIHQWPLTSSGKINRAALPEPSPDNLLGQADFRPPLSPIQVQVAGILSELLRVDRVGLDDNFFLLGGHSLLGAQVLLRIRQKFGVEMTLRGLFAAQTVAKLASEIERLLISKLDSMSEEEARQMLDLAEAAPE